MGDLVRWLEAQLDADERIARAATEGPWSVDSESYAESISAADGTQVVAGGRWGGEASVFESTEDALHIAAWDPARVLREIDADRDLLAEYERLLRAHKAHRQEADRLAESADDDPIRRNALRREADYLPAMLHVVERWAKRKAAVYADRPGYREEWRP